MAEEPSIYLSEVKVGYGESGKEAAAALDGYTILKNDSGGYADLNEGGSSTNLIQRKGTAVVYLGYKTTMYKTGTAAAPVTGSTFGTGALALASCGGVVAGAALTAFGMTAGRKKKEDK